MSPRCPSCSCLYRFLVLDLLFVLLEKNRTWEMSWWLGVLADWGGSRWIPCSWRWNGLFLTLVIFFCGGTILCIYSQAGKCKLLWSFSNLWCTRRIRICVFIDINILYIMAHMRCWFMWHGELYLLYMSEFQLMWNYSVPMNVVWYHDVYYNKNYKRLFKIRLSVYLDCLVQH